MFLLFLFLSSIFDLIIQIFDVVVTINYRLGALGFLTMGNDLAPGNLGIRDQILALTWVKTLIHHFGGDPTRVTIFGESAGGMSSHALTMSPKAYDLFSAAIFESGTMLAVKEKYGYSRTHRGSLAVADYFNCSSSSYDQEMLGCLQVRKFMWFCFCMRIFSLKRIKLIMGISNVS